MTFIDPTSGIGYAFGEILTSADMTTITLQQPRAWDIINGGTFTTTGISTINAPAGGRIIFSTGDVQFGVGVGEWQSGALPTITSRTFIYSQSMITATANLDRWSRVFTGLAESWLQTTDLPTATLDLALIHLPNQGTITEINMYIDGVAHNQLPTTLPTLRLREMDPDTGLVTTLETQVDPTSTVGAYNTYHPITMTVSPAITIDGSNRVLFCQLSGEDAAVGADVGKLLAKTLTVTCTCTEIAPG